MIGGHAVAYLYSKYSKKNVLALKKLTRRGYVAALFVSACTLVLMCMLLLMKLGNVGLSLHYAHGFVVVGSFVLLWFMRKERSFAFIGFFVLFFVDKLLLLSYGLITPLIGIPVALVFSVFFVQAIFAAVALPYAQMYNSASVNHAHSDSSFLHASLCVGVLLLLAVFVSTLSDLFYEALTLSAHQVLLAQGVVTVIAFALLQRKELYAMLGRFHMAVVNVVCIAIATLLSTFIVQHGTTPYKELEYYPKAFGPYLSKVFFF